MNSEQTPFTETPQAAKPDINVTPAPSTNKPKCAHQHVQLTNRNMRRHHRKLGVGAICLDCGAMFKVEKKPIYPGQKPMIASGVTSGAESVGTKLDAPRAERT